MATTLERFTPLTDLTAIERRMRRMFEDIGFAPALTPPADVYETTGEFVVELEVPGFDEEQIEIALADHTLTITGERAEEAKREEKTLHLHERLERHFERRFVLPAEADTGHVTAEYAKGVLTVHVPKTESATPKKVEITKR